MNHTLNYIKAGLVKPCLFFILLSVLLLQCTKKRPDEFELSIIHSSNLCGQIEPSGCAAHPLGGLSFRSAILQKLRSNRDVLIFDSGSLYFNFHNFKNVGDDVKKEALAKAAKIVNVMNKWDYTAVTIGDKDLSAGYKAWSDLQAKAKFPVVSINAKDENKLIKPYIVKKIRGIKILITGVTGAASTAPLFNTKKIKVHDHKKALKELLKKENADFVIVLSHSGIIFDKLTALQVDGIDLILGGLSSLYKGAITTRTTHIVHNGTFGQHISETVVKFKKNKETNTYNKTINTKFYTVDPSKLPEDLNVSKLISQ